MNIANIVITYGASPASRRLAEQTGQHLDLPVYSIGASEYPDGHSKIAMSQNIRGAKIIHIGSSPDLSFNFKPNDAVMEYRFAADMFKRGKAGSFYFVIPYLPYAREDRTKGERKALTLKSAIDTIMQVPPDGVMVVEPHTEYIELAFPNTHPPDILWLTNPMAFNLAHELKSMTLDLKDSRVFGVDHGTKVRVSQTVEHLVRNGAHINKDYFLAEKNRQDEETVEFMGFASSLNLENNFLFGPDDIVASGKTAILPARAAKKLGAAAVFAYGSHAALTLGKDGNPVILEELNKPNSAIDGLMLTNTLNVHPSVANHWRTWNLDISQYLALAIHNAFEVPYPGIENGQGSIRGLNKGESGSHILTPQPMPDELKSFLANRLSPRQLVLPGLG